jgi:RyR domain
VPYPEVSAELAAIAHRLWCDRMAATSWRYGTTYDERDRAHDAMVPFESLDSHEQRRAIRAVEYAGIADQLVRLIDHRRGPDREFTVKEMRAGLAVESVPSPDEPPAAADRGAIESWEVDAEGELTLIRVRWADGEVSEHLPAARELRRV